MLRKAVLAYMADRASDNGCGVWASKMTIAGEIECSKQAVIKTIKAFILEGVISEVGKRKTQGGYTVIYDLNLDVIKALPEREKQSTTITGQKIDRSTTFTGGVNPVDPDQSTTITQTVLEPSLNQQSKDCGELDNSLKVEHVVDEWNIMAAKIGKPLVKKMTPARRAKIKHRIAQNDLEDFVSVFSKIESSVFLRGDTGWHGCGFDWVFKAGNFQKILEGNYDD